MGDYIKALDSYHKAAEIYKKISYYDGIISSYNNIGNIYSVQFDFQSALENYKKGLEVAEKNRNRIQIANCFLSIGIVHLRKQEISNGLEYLNKALAIFEEMNSPREISFILRTIANNYYLQGNFTKSLEYYQKGFQISDSIGDKDGIIRNYSGMSKLYLKLKDLVSSKKFALKAMDLAKEVQNKDALKEVAIYLYKADSALGNWKEAFEAHQLFKHYHDSLENSNNFKELGKLQAKYQFEKDAETEKLAAKEKQLIETKAKARRDNLQYLSIFAGLLVISGIFLAMSKFSLPPRVMDIGLFTILLLLFEFLLILFDPYLDNFSGGIPFYKLAFNAVLAVFFSIFHGYAEKLVEKHFKH